MGSFTNALFQGMMDWVRVLLSSLWSVINGHGNEQLLNWISDHWLMLVLSLCLFGLAADGLVYLFRWKPYRVWGSFFRRIRQRASGNRTSTEQPEAAGQAISADVPVAVPELPREEVLPETEQVQEEQESAWAWDHSPEIGREEQRVLEATGARGYREPAMQESETPSEPEMGVTSRFEQAIRPRRRRARVTSLFSEEPAEQHYQAPQELIDRREAYHRPIYPRSWKGNKNQQS